MVYVLKAYLIKRLDYNRKSELCTIIVQPICTPCFNFEMLSCTLYLKSRNENLTLSCTVWNRTRATLYDKAAKFEKNSHKF